MAAAAFNVLLPDGRNVNLYTKEGTNAFLEASDNFEGISGNLEPANEIRRKKRLSGQEKQQLIMMYVMVETLAGNASEEIFAKLPARELEAWFDHANLVIRKLSKDQEYKSSGLLEEHDSLVLNACITTCSHFNAVEIALRKNFFQVLAVFVAARKAPLLPCSDVCETVCMIVSNARARIVTPPPAPNTSKAAWENEKIFKKLESCGMLGQFIRCATVSQQHDDPRVMHTFDELITCSALIKNKFKKGETCGDIIYAILTEKDGPTKTRNNKVIKYLETLARFAGSMQPHGAFVDPETGDSRRICRHCTKSEMSTAFQKSLLVCSRCHQAYYCSKECQVADWKKHKPMCNPSSKGDTKRAEASEQQLMSFAQRNYAPIMKELLFATDELSVSKEQLVLELDFQPDKRTGVAPALSDNPPIRFRKTRDYINGTREAAWFRDMPETSVKQLLSGLEDHFNRMTPNHLLCLVRYPLGVSVYRLHLQTEKTGIHMFGKQAFDAFEKAIDAEDYSLLEKIFDDEQMAYIKSEIDLRNSRKVQDAMAVLRKRFGAAF